MAEPSQRTVKGDRLKELFPKSEWRGNIPPALTHVADDSRKVKGGGIFIAISGYETDGHKYLESAVKSGAGLLVVEREVIETNPEILKPAGGTPLLITENTRLAASILANEFYGHPSREFEIHGITGTKGKTTTVHILAGILKTAGRKPATMGTLGIEFGDEHWRSDLTTPGPIEFHSRLRFLADLGATDLCCEVSAHAGALSRTSSVKFASVTYLNLSRDHGDHFSEDEYLDAKVRIVKDAVNINPDIIAIGNIRDPHYEAFVNPTKKGNRLSFAAFEENEDHENISCDLKVRIVEHTSQDLNIVINTSGWKQEIALPLVGRFNAQNAAAAASIASAIGISGEKIGVGLSLATPIPGRLERIDMGQDFLVVVDYAHAPQPAAEVLACLRDLTRGRLIGVMGAGGSRDRGKRPLIGEVLSRDCDIAVITSDNPRKEEPLDIINDILVGVTRENSSTEIITEVDRSKAIGIALGKALPGDTVAILGKGHETYQIFKDRTIDFDDREVAREWLLEKFKERVSE